MTIIIVSFPSFGGSGAVATELGIKLAERGHDIHFISYDLPFRLTEEAWRKNIILHTVEPVEHPVLINSPVYTLSLSNKIAEVARRYKADIIHTHYAVPHAASAYFAKVMPGTDAKLINTFHGTDVSQLSQNLNLKELMSHSLNQFDALTAVAQALGSSAEHAYSLKKPVETIYNWVETQPYDQKQAIELRELFSANGEKIITHISNFREVKRIEDVIKIYLKISKRLPVKLLLIGDGPEQRVAHRLISKHRLMNHVHMLGLQSNISRILSISDLFLLPSSSEAFSLAALEALSFGVPVIATEVGGMPEMIEHGKHGYLAKVGDIDGMAGYGIKILSSPEHHQELSKAAAKRAASEYSADRIITQYEELYKRVISA